MLTQHDTSKPSHERPTNGRSPLLLKVTDIDLYDLNPRHTRNERYEDLRASIRATGGIDSPLTVTRRPNASPYTVRFGCNTRLEILQALCQGIRYPRFLEVYCLYIPWSSESRGHCAHLIENEKRSPLTLLDKAYRLKKQKELLEVELNAHLSQSQFVKGFAKAGYTITQPMLFRHEYEWSTLATYLPEARAMNRLTLRDIESLRTLRARHGKYGRGIAFADRKHIFEDMYLDCLSQLYGEHFSLAALANEQNEKIAKITDTPTMNARISNNAIGHKGGIADPPPLVDPLASTPRADTETRPNTREAQADPGSRPRTTPPEDLASLRRRTYEIAPRISERHKLATCVSAYALGVGYLVDLPVVPVSNKKKPAWWTLLICSEQDHLDKLTRLSDGKLVRNIRLGARPKNVYSATGQAEVGFYWFFVATTLTDCEFNDFVLLLTHRRQIRAFLKRRGGLLWDD